MSISVSVLKSLDSSAFHCQVFTVGCAVLLLMNIEDFLFLLVRSVSVKQWISSDRSPLPFGEEHLASSILEHVLFSFRCDGHHVSVVQHFLLNCLVY